MDGLELDAMQQSADALESGVPVRETVLAIISGETRLDGDFLKTTWNALKGTALARFREIGAAFLMPLIAAAVFRRMTAGASGGELICACVCAGIFIKIAIASLDEARRLIDGVAGALEAAIPVLTGLSALGGGTSSAALITPAATLIGEVLVQLIGSWGTGLCSASAICACAAAIGPGLKLDGLFSFIKRIIQVGAGLVLALFAGILKVQGMLGASFDSAAVKTARYAVDKIVPTVGGGIADTMDAAISSVQLIRSAVGVTGMLIIASACAAPVLKLCATLCAIRISRVIAQPVAESNLADAADRFADVIRLLIVLCMTAVTLGLILTGAAIGAGRSISG